MAFNSYDQIIAAMSAGLGYEVPFNKTPTFTAAAGVPNNLWWSGGMPSAGGYSGGTNGVNGATGTNSATNAYMGNCDNLTGGAIDLTSVPTAASGTNPYVLGFGAASNVTLAGTLVLVDRMADSGQLTTALSGTTTIAPPSGSVWKRSADGKGVMMWLESSGTAPAGASTFTIGYTGVKEDGTTSSGTTATITLAATQHRVFTGTVAPYISLAAGHVGVSPTANITINTVATSAISNVSLVVGRILAILPVSSAYQYVERDMVLQTPRMPKLPVSSDDRSACLEILLVPGAAVSPTSVYGSVPIVVG